jgi:RNA polymerase sigma factor (TIGR02999 family)
MSSPDEVTALLRDWSDGKEEALQKLMPLLHRELHQLAHRYMRGERPGHTLQTTALINEAYLRLIDWKNVQWKNRAHFFGVSAQLMRRILVDFARVRDNLKNGAGVRELSLEEVPTFSQDRAREIVALDEALRSLAAFDPRKSRIVELRFFGGLSVEETAEVMNVSPRTVLRDWDLAKAWLHRELSADSNTA